MSNGDPMMTFESKRDAWLVALIWGAVLVCGYSALAQFWSGAPLGIRAPALIGLGASAAFMLWVLYGTRYRLSDTELLILCGPFRYRVLLKEIRSVEPSRNPLSSPACSLDRLAIRWGAGGKRILISPEDKSAFMRILKERSAQLDWEGKRLLSRAKAEQRQRPDRVS